MSVGGAGGCPAGAGEMGGWGWWRWEGLGGGGRGSVEVGLEDGSKGGG